jgi:hypothetical protein
MTIGLDRNNPFNLMPSHVQWFGLSAAQPDQGPLEFENLTDGIRAGVKLCYTYQGRGFNTIASFIPEFSPAYAGNPVEQYMKNMCSWTGFSMTQPLDFRDPATMLAFAKGVFRQEQGVNGITDDQITAGISLADTQ